MEAEDQGVAEGDGVDGPSTRQLIGIDYVTTEMVCLFGGPNKKAISVYQISG